jgi:hypothetical protein
MMRDEHEDYGDDSRDVIAGLRHLAQQGEAPADLLATIMTRGQQLLPHQRAHRSWWQRLLAPWHIRPLVWGPVVALVGFIAGVFVPLPSDTFPPAPPARQASQPADTPLLQSKELASRAPAPRSRQEQHSAAPPVQDEAERRASPPASAAPASPGEAMLERRGAGARSLALPDKRAPVTPDTAPPVVVTLTLPAVLYEQLVSAAEQHHTDLSTLLQEAIEAHVARGK